jgi:aromatic ring-cleaving dioxygenase
MPTETPGATAAASDPRPIAEYHAHVYYDPQKTRARAARLRERVAAEFPQARLGRWHDRLVGPHTQSMYQIAFPSSLLASFLPWLMLNRDGLTIRCIPKPATTFAITPRIPLGSAVCCRCASTSSRIDRRRINPTDHTSLWSRRLPR